MAKYTSQDIKELANNIRYEAQQGRPFAVLMGAGCSISAGIPAVPGLLKIINDHAHGENVRTQLDCPTLESEDYGRVMSCLTLDERKDILGPILNDAKVNWGHIALTTLMKAKFIGRVLTFNFDSVLARASGVSGHYPATYDFGVSPADTFDHIVTPSILHLHGQGHGLAMMNSEDETLAHAEKLSPLFKDTFEKSNVIVIGYSGEGDKVFPKINAAFTNRKRLFWCNFEERSPSPHVAEILAKAKNTAKYFEGVDFDTFMIELAQELKTFPPTLFTDPAQHLLDDIEPIIEPPAELRGASELLVGLQTKLEQWKSGAAATATVSEKIQKAMLEGNWNTAIALNSEPLNQQDKATLGWAFVMKANEVQNRAKANKDANLFQQSFENYAVALKLKPEMHEALNNWGNALVGLARLKGDEVLFRQSFEKYEAALKLKPDKHEALNNWGNALVGLARLKGDEMLFRQSFEKYEAALKLKPDDHEALDNWGNALSGLFHLTGDTQILTKLEDISDQEEKISGKANYNLACAYALQD